LRYGKFLGEELNLLWRCSWAEQMEKEGIQVEEHYAGMDMTIQKRGTY
jgi:hypothetical protein